jgi:hypothetical protein
MNWFFYIILAIILILLVPIPVKLTVAYEDNKLCLYIYNFNIKLDKKAKAKSKKAKKKVPKIPELELSDLKELINRIDCSRFKPTLRMHISLIYGLLDACSTGVAYGIINSLSPFLYKMLTIVFKVKKFKLDVKPDFDQLIINTRIKSIIFINLGKIIYILMIILKFFKAIKQKHNEPCKAI